MERGTALLQSPIESDFGRRPCLLHFSGLAALSYHRRVVGMKSTTSKPVFFDWKAEDSAGVPFPCISFAHSLTACGVWRHEISTPKSSAFPMFIILHLLLFVKYFFVPQILFPFFLLNFQESDHRVFIFTWICGNFQS